MEVIERPNDRLLSIDAVQGMIPYTRQHIARLSKAGKFPAPVKLGERRIAFLESEITKWIADLPRGWQKKPRSLREARR